MAVAYATKVELKARIDKTRATDDTVIEGLILAASRSIDTATGRPDDAYVALAVAVARVFSVRGGKAYLQIDECVEITKVAVKEGVDETTYADWVAADWIAFRGDPKEPDFNRVPYTWIMTAPGGDYATFLSGRYREHTVPTVQVTAKWGYSVVCPPQVREATIVQAARWYKRGQVGWADALGSADFGTLSFSYRKAIDPDVKAMLAGLIRRSI